MFLVPTSLGVSGAPLRPFFRFIDSQVAAVERLSVKCANNTLKIIGLNGHEAKATWSSGVPIRWDPGFHYFCVRCNELG